MRSKIPFDRAQDTPFFIVNPNSGGGKTGRFWKKILPEVRKVLGAHEAVLTGGPADATRKARQALNQGYRRLVAVGGDGTLNEVLNGCFQEGKPIDSDIELAVFSSGSGEDFAKSLRWPHDPLQALCRLKERKLIPVDAGRVTYFASSERQETRYFINIADFGLGARVMRGVNASKKLFGSQLTYLYHSVRSLLHYRKVSVVLEFGGKTLPFPEIVIGIIANGKYFGRGLCVAPEADLSDGLFNMILVEGAGAGDFLKWLPKLYRGQKIEGKRIHRFKTDKIVVRSEGAEPVLIVTDGEQPGGLPATFEIVPKALKVCV